MTELVKLTRKRPTEYSVNFDNGIKKIPFKWAGAKNGKEHTLAVPREVFDWLNMATKAIKTGALAIAESEPLKEEITNEISELDEHKANSHSKEEIVTLLKGNINKMKKELSDVTSKQEKIFIMQVADELKDSKEGFNTTKYEFISEWSKANVENN